MDRAVKDTGSESSGSQTAISTEVYNAPNGDILGTQLTKEDSQADAVTSLKISILRARECIRTMRADLRKIYFADHTQEDAISKGHRAVNAMEDHVNAMERDMESQTAVVLESRLEELRSHWEGWNARRQRYTVWRELADDLDGLKTSKDYLQNEVYRTRRALTTAGGQGLTILADYWKADHHLEDVETWRRKPVEEQASSADIKGLISLCVEKTSLLEDIREGLNSIPAPQMWEECGGSFPSNPPREWAKLLDEKQE